MLKIHEARSERLVLSLYEKYQARKLFYERHNITHAPQNVFIPNGMTRGSKDHIRWLFFAALTDRRQISNEVYKAHVRIFSNHPELYDARGLKYSVSEIENILVKHNVGVPRQSAKYWGPCIDTLYNEFGGDPLLIYKVNGNTVEGIQKYRKEFQKRKKYNPLPGYGPKISSLYAMFLAELDVLTYPKDAFAVDVHVQRIFLQTNCLTLYNSEINENLEKVLRPFLCKMCRKHNLNKVDLAHAFWFLGSTLCTNCHSRGDVPLLCPVYEMCGGPVNTMKYFIEGRWDPEDKRKRKGGCNTFKLASGPLFEQNVSN